MKVDYHIFKSAVNYLGLHMDVKNRPTFFDVPKDYPALDAVTKAYPIIRKEFDRVMAEGLSLPQYHEVDSGERAISSTTPKRWNVFMLECLGYQVGPNVARCPETMKALSGVPNMVQAFFSILDPGKSVPEHEGPYLVSRPARAEEQPAQNRSQQPGLCVEGRRGRAFRRLLTA